MDNSADDFLTVPVRFDRTGAWADFAAVSVRPIVTASTKPFGVRVTHPDSSAVTTEWFDTLQQRTRWIAQTQDVWVDHRALVRLTDRDEHGAFLDGREVFSLPALAEDARDLVQLAGLRHAAFHHHIAATELRTVWPTATAIVADLASPLDGEGVPFVEEIRDASGAVLWTPDRSDSTDPSATDSTDTDGGDTDIVDRVAEHLGSALSYADVDLVGWQPLTEAQLAEWAVATTPFGEYYALTLPVTSPPLPNAGDH